MKTLRILDTDLELVRLGRHHVDAGAVFKAWHQIWLSLSFRAWNIEEYLPAIPCPVLALQGQDDEYGSLEQIKRIARQARDVELVKLAEWGHSPHKDPPAAGLEGVSGFVARVIDGRQ